MSVSTNNNRFSQVGDGVNTAFNYPSYFKSKNELSVIVVDSLGNVIPKVLDVDYNVVGFVTAGFGYLSGAMVNFVTAPLATETVILINNPDPLQNTVLAPNSSYPPKKIESTFDSLVLMIQRITDILFFRTVSLKDADTKPFDPTLPMGIGDISNKGRVIITDPVSGDSFVMGPNADDIGNAQLYAAQAAASAAAAAISEANAGQYSILANMAAADAAANLQAIQSFVTGISLTDTTGGPVAVNLPAVVAGTPMSATFINKSFNSGNDLTLTPVGIATNIMGAPSINVGSGEIAQMWFDGVDTWWKLN